MTTKSHRLRELIAGPRILVMPGVYDGFSARLTERMGFEAAMLSGAGLSESHLGQPDVGIMGLKENVDASHLIASCTELPLLADGDTGYGNAVNVHFTVRAFEDAGVAGVMIEDQVWPKRCGHMAGKEVIDAEEGVQKIRAAVDARRDPDFVIKARTDAAGPLGIEEAIRRANQYAEAGADLIFADALLNVKDMERVVKEVQAPMAVNMGFGIRKRPTTPLLSVRQLEEIGFAAVSVPRMLSAAALRGMLNAVAVFKESLETGEAVDRPDLAVSFDELNEIMGFEFIRDLESRYLTEEQLKVKYG
ncbi:MAG: isocitrate lyase/PEP mutase family protein [Deinococcales bacterium]|jgi:2-methylisocitrate lyase-like PEP mutase family enzyme